MDGAAAGITEQSDAVVLVVSEEKGIISLSIAGKISPGIEPENLRQVLAEFLNSRKEGVPAKAKRAAKKVRKPRKKGKR